MADAPFVALVMPEDGDVKVYVKGIEPEQMVRIQRAIDRILSGRPDANPDADWEETPTRTYKRSDLGLDDGHGFLRH